MLDPSDIITPERKGLWNASQPTGEDEKIRIRMRPPPSVKENVGSESWQAAGDAFHTTLHFDDRGNTTAEKGTITLFPGRSKTT